VGPLHWYDIFMLVVIIGFTLFGMLKGMAWQLASLGSLVVSFYVAVHFSPVIAPMLSKQEPWNRYLAMLILYLVTSLGIWLLFRLVSGAIDRVKLQEFDRQLGALFGLAKGLLLSLVITFFAVTLAETTRQAVLSAKSGQCAAWVNRHAVPLLPADVREMLGKYIDEFNRKLDPNTPPANADEDPVKKTVKEAVDKTLQKAGKRAGEIIDGK
jgi:membrane protein required for colicin V production